MPNVFQLVVNTVNGVIKEFPPTVSFTCEEVFPYGVQIVRDYDADLTIIATRVFVFRYKNDLYGVNQFGSLTDWWTFINGVCGCCPCPTGLMPTINGCSILINGCQMLLGVN